MPEPHSSYAGKMIEIGMTEAWRRGGALALLLVTLPGCAVVPGAAGSGSGALVAGSTLALPAEQANAGPADAMIRRALVQQLNSKGFVVAADAAMKLHFGLAVRDPAIGFTLDDAVPDERPVAAGEAPAYRNAGVSLCRDEVVRLSIAIYRTGAVAPAFSSAAEDMVCGTLTAGKAALLVDTALRPLASR